MTELSVVIPCLNEADTVADCIERAQRGLSDGDVEGEVIVADNGSTDESIAIAERLGARVVHVSERGYGAALMGGIAAAEGRYAIMGDADGTYDFLEIPKFAVKLREGFDLVQGCRLPAGGGTVMPGAMPWLHRWIGNPLLTFLSQRMFRAPIHDVYCGLRGFSLEHYRRLDQRCTGMEFAVEMIVKSSLGGARIAEVPITLHVDGRIAHGPHLKTFRDGWRTLRYFLLLSPRWLFLAPGIALIALGLAGYALGLPGVVVFDARIDVHTLLVASLALLCGYQSILFAIFARTFATTEKLMPPSPFLERFYRVATLERGLVLGALGLLAGTWMVWTAFAEWRAVDYGDLDYAQTMRWVIPGVTVFCLAFQTVIGGFLVSLLGLARR